MENELDSFFAKKKGKKKRGVQDVNDLAKKLEQTSKAEMEELKEVEGEPDATRETDVPIKPNATEDNEWIEFDEDAEVDLEDLKLKELDLRDNVMTSENVENEEAEKKEPVWHVAKPSAGDANDDDSNETDGHDQESASSVEPGGAATAVNAASASSPEPVKYVAPSRRSGALGSASFQKRPLAAKIAPNLDDADLFPTLTSAATIDTQAPKKKVPWSSTGKKDFKDAEGYQQVQQSANPNAYVPPHLRKAQHVSTSNAFTILSEKS